MAEIKVDQLSQRHLGLRVIVSNEDGEAIRGTLTEIRHRRLPGALNLTDVEITALDNTFSIDLDASESLHVVDDTD